MRTGKYDSIHLRTVMQYLSEGYELRFRAMPRAGCMRPCERWWLQRAGRGRDHVYVGVLPQTAHALLRRGLIEPVTEAEAEVFKLSERGRGEGL
jgi:hypothetical protein